MSTSTGPFQAPVNSASPGLGLPVLGLTTVFLLGLVCVGLILALGEPTDDSQVAMVGTESVEESDTATNDPKPRRQDAQGPTTPTKPRISPDKGSPFPRHGEAEAPPIPPTRLIDDESLDTPPPQASSLPAPEGPVPWDEAHKYMDRVITVRGTILDTNNIGNICFLNYDPDWQGKFYIAMFKEAFELLPDPPEEHYLDKTLLVTGKVTLHRDRPQIEVHDASQIEVVE